MRTGSASKRGLDILITVATRIGGKSVNLIVFVILAHSLSLSDMGAYGYLFTSAFILSTVLDFGIRNSVAFFIGSDEARLREYSSQVSIISGFMGLAVPVFALGIVETSPVQLDLSSFLVPMSILIWAMLYIRMGQGVFLGAGSISEFNKSDLVARLCLLIGTVLLVAFDELDLNNALYSLALSQLIGAAYLGIVTTKNIGWRFSIKLEIWRSLFGRGAMFMLSVLLMSFAKKMSFYAVSQYLAAENAGVFFGLQRTTEILTEVALAVAVVMFSHGVRGNGKVEILRQSAQSTRISFFVLLIIGAVFAVFSPWLLPLMLGQQFGDKYVLFIIVLCGTLVGSIWTMIYPTYSVVTSPTHVFALFIPGVILNAAVLYAVLPPLGMLGAALAFLFVNLFVTLVFLASIKIKYNLSPWLFVLLRREDLDPIVSKILRRVRRK